MDTREKKPRKLDRTVQDGTKHLLSATGLILSICWRKSHSR